MRVYSIPYPNGENRGVRVEEFKDATESYIRERIAHSIKHPLIIRQRLYRNGRWILRAYTCYTINGREFHKTYDKFWDMDDIKQVLDEVIEDYEEWISFRA